MSFPVAPPDTRAPGYPGHISDHNAISDVLSALTSQVTTLTSAVAGGITLSSVQNANYTPAGGGAWFRDLPRPVRLATCGGCPVGGREPGGGWP